MTLAVVAVYLGGLASAMFSVLFLLSRDRLPTDLVVTVSLVGAGIILFGLLSVAAAAGCRGERAVHCSSRWWVPC